MNLTTTQAPLRLCCMQAVELFFRRSYDVVNGDRVCKACGMGRLDTPSAHAEGCWVDAALAEAIANTKGAS